MKLFICNILTVVGSGLDLYKNTDHRKTIPPRSYAPHSHCLYIGSFSIRDNKSYPLPIINYTMDFILQQL